MNIIAPEQYGKDEAYAWEAGYEAGRKAVLANNQEQILQYLKDNLRLDSTTTSDYIGDMDGNSLYKDFHSIELILDGEIISSISL